MFKVRVVEGGFLLLCSPMRLPIFVIIPVSQLWLVLLSSRLRAANLLADLDQHFSQHHLHVYFLLHVLSYAHFSLDRNKTIYFMVKDKA